MRAVLLLTFVVPAALSAADFAPIARVLPPPGIEIPAEKKAAWTAEIAGLRKQLAAAKSEAAADVEVFLKAVEFAMELGEFYGPKDFAKADNLLKHARERIEKLAAQQTPWQDARGLVVRGFVSRVDGSVQPYGLVIPEDVNPRGDQRVPLYIFLHGRGDKQTDLHFIEERLRGKGEIHPPGAIVLHPFGRQCVGYKSAGETDVLEAVAHVKQNYAVDPNRVVLMGFSMGGAGAWHVGAKYANQWRVVAPGAGFAETARYTKSDPSKVAWYERELWGCNDAPCYVRNLFNLKTVAYSGELDKQIQAARVMEEAFAAEGLKLDHRIGPGVEHKYEPKTLQTLLKDIGEEVRDDKFTERASAKETWYWQGRTLRYTNFAVDRTKANLADAVSKSTGVLALERHWDDARLTHLKHRAEIETKNVRAFSDFAIGEQDESVKIDGQVVKLPADLKQKLRNVTFVKGADGWKVGEFPPPTGLWKIPGLQGPIDDAFLEPFLFVLPTGESKHPGFAKWAKFEADHAIARWTALMRGKPRVKTDREVTVEDLKMYHVVLWGDPDSNLVLAKLKDQLPVKFSADAFELRGSKYDRNTHAPTLIYPNPQSPQRYVVLNSGLTFREAHDKTNSQQNPKLPDWAVIDLSENPSAAAAGKIADAGFFDEQWRVQPAESRN